MGLGLWAGWGLGQSSGWDQGDVRGFVLSWPVPFPSRGKTECGRHREMSNPQALVKEQEASSLCRGRGTWPAGSLLSSVVISCQERGWRGGQRPFAADFGFAGLKQRGQGKGFAALHCLCPFLPRVRGGSASPQGRPPQTSALGPS